MSNKAIAITIAFLLAATGYLLFKSDGDIDMGGENMVQRLPKHTTLRKMPSLKRKSKSSEQTKTPDQRTGRGFIFKIKSLIFSVYIYIFGFPNKQHPDD